MPAAATTWITHEVATHLLREVASRCADVSIPLLPVKGVLTARLLYEDVADRIITDVDVRIRPRDFTPFLRMARAAGWRRVRIARTYCNLIYDFPGLSLDVEGSVGPPGLCGLTVDTMLSRATFFPLAPDFSVLAPEVHDHAVVLVINVFKDKMSAATVRAVSDVERIARHPSFSTDTFVERAVQSRIATIAWLVAGWMESRGSAPWGAVRLALDGHARVRRGYARLFRRLLRDGDGDRRTLALRLLARVGADTRFMQADALVRAVAWEIEMGLRGRKGAADR